MDNKRGATEGHRCRSLIKKQGIFFQQELMLHVLIIQNKPLDTSTTPYYAHFKAFISTPRKQTHPSPNGLVHIVATVDVWKA